jgi:hypothetical protein
MFKGKKPMAFNAMLDKALSDAALKSDLVDWLINDNSPAGLSTLDFLHNCVDNIPPQKHSGIGKKLAGDASQIEATIHELVAHELLYRLTLSPEYEPLVNGKRPDLRFNARGMFFLADVYLAHSPSRTLTDFDNRTGAAIDRSKPGESRAFKIEEMLSEKAAKYKDCSMPLVVFVFLGDRRLLSVFNVEQALYGMTAREAGLEQQFPNNISPGRVPVGGLLLPDSDGNTPHNNLSAVVCCDWFDTLNPQDRGKRLYCKVLHNWAADVTLSPDGFKPFQQITWRQHEPDIWKPEITIEDCIVAKFTTDGKLECRSYTADKPW